jgi:leucyl/phenylalanyl-tRNA---protein transferase
MPVFRLDERVAFPPPDLAEDGLLAVGGDLRPERLLTAYSQGIFPWYEDGLPILWHSPDPRMVLRAEDLHVPRSLAKTMRRRPYQVTLDSAFRDVVGACAATARPGQEGTWITAEMIEAYVVLHRLGFAHSVEAWRGDELVGGLYGVSLGAVFFGESMFSRAPDASKVAFVTLVRDLARRDIRLIDCQVHTEHLARFGATEWPRARFLKALAIALRNPTRKGKWRLGATPAAAAAKADRSA